MATEKLSFRVSRAQEGQTLEDFVFAQLSETYGRRGDIEHKTQLSKARVRTLIVAGAVFLSPKQVWNPSIKLVAKARVVVNLDAEKLFRDKGPKDTICELEPEDILYEDEWLIVVDKPSGIPTEATVVASRDHLHAALKRYVSVRDGTVEPYVGLHHRLDRETSGVVLFTKREEVNASVFRMFSEHLVRKEYEALTGLRAKPIADNFRVENRLDRITPLSQQGKWGAVAEGGDYASTEFEVIRRGNAGLQLAARPMTGRTHQIRVHLAGCGLPILGDALYGGAGRVGPWTVPRVMLHAASLHFPHPVTGKSITVQSPLPRDFRTCLENV